MELRPQFCRSRRLFCTFAWALLIFVIAAANRAVIAESHASGASTVSMTVNFNDGVRKVFVLPWKQDMTVLDAMNLAQANPHGLTFASTGSGATAFLTKIDDVENEGGGVAKKNWLYWVNDKFADRSFGVFKLEAGDYVLWKYDVFRKEDETKK
jgi:hypothetical protein